MLGIENYFGFLIAGILLNLTPGADTIYILTRSISQGRKAGLYSVLGIGSGILVHITFAAMGLSIILSTSAIAFSTIKYLGVAYLIYLGIKMIRDKSNPFEKSELTAERASLKKIYKQGVLTNVLNPKVALFFLSFLPQFINPHHSNGPVPFLILGGTFFATGTLWCSFLVYCSSYMTKKFRSNFRSAKIIQKLSGLVFIGLGIQIAFRKN